MRRFLKLTNNFLIYLLFRAFIFFSKFVGIRVSSDCSGKFFSYIGKYTKTGWIVRNNLTYTGYENEKIISLEEKIWENFGRYVGEFAYIESSFLKSAKNVRIKNTKVIEGLKSENTKFIIFSGHLANWDYILYKLLNVTGGAGVIYRKINNPFIDKYVKSKRSFENTVMIEKGPYGAKDLIKLVKQNKNLLILVDQKMNEGINVPFLARPANTAPAPAVIARQYKYALVPLRIKRVNNYDFELEFEPAFFVNNTDDKDKDVYEATKKINDIISLWIQDKPEDWFWMHQRWGKPSEMNFKP